MSIAREAYNIVEFLKSTLLKSGTNGFALGMSGGIDSSVCAALASRAVDELNSRAHDSPFTADPEKKFKIDLIILPMGNIAGDAVCATEVAESLGLDIRTVELGDALAAFTAALHPTVDGHTQPDVKSLGNLKARMRMSAIYYSANMNNLLVLGTDNLSETYTGYFTKHGDGAADVFPLSDFTKREVYELGRFLGLPEAVRVRLPSAGLWDGQTDEQEMGVPYNFIDNHLEGMSQLNRDTYSNPEYQAYRSKLSRLHDSTQHKRDQPHVFRRGTGK